MLRDPPASGALFEIIYMINEHTPGLFYLVFGWRPRLLVVRPGGSISGACLGSVANEFLLLTFGLHRFFESNRRAFVLVKFPSPVRRRAAVREVWTSVARSLP